MKAEEKIYEAYLKLKFDRLYFNQLKEFTQLSNSSLQNALNKFVKNDILIQEKTKSNTFYKIKNKKLFAIKFSEIAIRQFNELNREQKKSRNNLKVSFFNLSSNN